MQIVVQKMDKTKVFGGILGQRNMERTADTPNRVTALEAAALGPVYVHGST